MVSIAMRSPRLAAVAVAIAALVTAPGCQRLASRFSQGEAPTPAAPAAGTGAAPGAVVTPKTQAPNEARVLSSAFSAAARALGPSVVRIDVEIPSHGQGSGGQIGEGEGEGDGEGEGEDRDINQQEDGK
jgi:hypothetical protein